MSFGSSCCPSAPARLPILKRASTTWQALGLLALNIGGDASLRRSGPAGLDCPAADPAQACSPVPVACNRAMLIQKVWI